MCHTPRMPFRARSIVISTLVIAGWLAAGLSALPASAETDREPQVHINKTDKGLSVRLDDKLFTVYRWDGFPKPILYPVNGPYGHGLTRDWPMKSDTTDEEHDHNHHQSLWFAHGDVNGVSFWHRKEDSGTIKHDKILDVQDGATGLIKTRNRWVGPDGNLFCTDVRTIRFDTVEGGRLIDYAVRLQAPADHKVVLGDTKEGTMGIRTTPELRLQASNGAKNVNGQAINSHGTTGKSVWGQRAKWVDYWGKVKGDTVGVAIFDHPDNPRHPTWWHARYYGLVAANPFGISYFDDKPRGTGDMTIPAGESRTFKYRFYFHKGDHQQADIEAQYKQFAETAQ